MSKMIISGLLVGLAFGYILQRGRFCLNCAFRDAFFGKNFALIRAYFLALLTQLFLVNILAEAGLLKLAAPTFFWLAAVVGGFLFGIGMVLSHGCVSAIWYRSGEGKVAAMLGVVGFASGLGLAQTGLMTTIQKALRFQAIEVNGGFTTLANIFGINLWIAVIVVAVILGLGLRGPVVRVRGGWSWAKTGVLLGVLGVIAWIASSSSGRLYGLSGTDTTGSLFNSLLKADFSLTDWGTFMILATPFGSFLAARATGEFKLRIPNFKQGLRSLSGGLLMGFGAMTATGCSIGHALTGVSILAMSSITATIFIFVGVVVGNFIIDRPRSL